MRYLFTAFMRTWRLSYFQWHYCLRFFILHSLLVQMHTSLHGRIVKSQLRGSVLCITEAVNNWPRSCKPIFYLVGYYRRRFFCQPLQRLDKMITLQCGLFSVRNGRLPNLRNYGIGLQKALRCSEKLKNHASVLFFHLIVGMVLVMTVSVASSRTPSCKF